VSDIVRFPVRSPNGAWQTVIEEFLAGFAPSFDMTITTARYRRDPQTMKCIASGDLVRE
jgi:hypothetical protein